MHGVPRRVKASVQIDGPDQGLHRIGGDRRPFPSARGFLSFSEEQELSEADIGRAQRERRLADHGRAQLGQFSLRQVRMEAEQVFAADDLEHGVSEEFEALIAPGPRHAVFVRIRTVGAGRAKKRRIPKPISDPSLQFFLLSVSHVSRAS